MDVLFSQVTLGVFGHEEAVISNPLSPGVIKDIIYSKCNPYDEREAVLQQELVIHIGWIISNTPELFSGMLKIRVGSVIFTLLMSSIFVFCITRFVIYVYLLYIMFGWETTLDWCHWQITV